MILLVGRSGSGKDTNVIANGYTMVTSNTTRDPRPGEVPDVKYHFHPVDTTFPPDDLVIAKTIKCGRKYWVTIDDLYDDQGNLKECFIIDYKGVEFLRTKFSPGQFAAMFTVVFLDCPYRILFRNLRHRRGERLGFVLRRMLEDMWAFAGAATHADVTIRYADGYTPDLRGLDV